MLTRGVFAATLGGAQGRPASSVGYRWPSMALSRRKGSLCRTVVDSGARDTRWLVPEGAVSTIAFLCASIFLKGNQGTWRRVESRWRGCASSILLFHSRLPPATNFSPSLKSRPLVRSTLVLFLCSQRYASRCRFSLRSRPFPRCSFLVYFSPGGSLNPLASPSTETARTTIRSTETLALLSTGFLAKTSLPLPGTLFRHPPVRKLLDSWANLNLTTNYCDRRPRRRQSVHPNASCGKFRPSPDFVRLLGRLLVHRNKQLLVEITRGQSTDPPLFPALFSTQWECPLSAILFNNTTSTQDSLHKSHETGHKKAHND